MLKSTIGLIEILRLRFVSYATEFKELWSLWNLLTLEKCHKAT